MLAHSTGSLNDFHPAVIAAVTDNAERQAVMVAEVLGALDIQLKTAGFPAGVGCLPAGFLLELGAICQLALWEQEGLRDYLPSDLPTSEQAKAEMHRRALTTPDSFQSTEISSLSCQVVRVWLERFAWSAPHILQANVLVGEADEDALVDAIAQLLWENRHLLTTEKEQNPRGLP